MAFLRIKSSGIKNHLYRVSTYREQGKVKQNQEYLHVASEGDEENLRKKNIGDIRCIKFNDQQMRDLTDFVWKTYVSIKNEEIPEDRPLRSYDMKIAKILAQTLWERICAVNKQIDKIGTVSRLFCFMSPNEIDDMLTMVSKIGSEEFSDWLNEILNDPLNPVTYDAPWRRRMREVEQ